VHLSDHRLLQIEDGQEATLPLFQPPRVVVDRGRASAAVLGIDPERPVIGALQVVARAERRTVAAQHHHVHASIVVGAHERVFELGLHRR